MEERFSFLEGTVMEKKRVLLKLLDFALTARNDLVARLNSEEKSATGTWKRWSAKDAFAHIAHWLGRDLQNIEKPAGPILLFDENNIDAENRKIYDAWANKSWDEVGRFFSDTYERAKTLVGGMDEKRLHDNLERTDGSKRPIWQSIAGHGLTHVTSHLGLVYRRRTEIKEATALEEKAAKLLRDLDDGPEWRGTIQYNLACHYALVGQKQPAIVLLKEALQLDPKLTEWSKKDPDFDGIRNDPDFAEVYS